MTPGGTIGAATPVQMGMPSEGMKPVEEKVVSYMRKEMKATAEAKGRRSDIAEAMVDSDVEIEGINKKGKVLTLTTDEAVKHGIAAYQVGTLVELQEKLGVAGRAPEHAAVNWAERVARALTNPVVSSLLMTVGFLGLLIELYTGGHGFALLASLVCLGLFFFGHMVVRLAGWEEIALFAAGAILLGVEIFVIPGFRLTGALGILAIVASLVMALVDLRPIPLDVVGERDPRARRRAGDVGDRADHGARRGGGAFYRARRSAAAGPCGGVDGAREARSGGSAACARRRRRDRPSAGRHGPGRRAAPRRRFRRAVHREGDGDQGAARGGGTCRRSPRLACLRPPEAGRASASSPARWSCSASCCSRSSCSSSRDSASSACSASPPSPAAGWSRGASSAR